MIQVPDFRAFRHYIEFSFFGGFMSGDGKIKEKMSSTAETARAIAEMFALLGRAQAPQAEPQYLTRQQLGSPDIVISLLNFVQMPNGAVGLNFDNLIYAVHPELQGALANRIYETVAQTSIPETCTETEAINLLSRCVIDALDTFLH